MNGPRVALRPVRPRDASLARLEPRERGWLPARATARRRAEYAAGRLAAHAALKRLLGGAAAGAAVLPERGSGGGRPVAVDDRDAPLAAHLSITHAAGLAAAAAAPLPVGIDLVALEPVEDALRSEAFVPGEVAAWEQWAGIPGGSREAACVAFAAKEAALKWLGTGLALPLHAVAVHPAGPGSPSRLGGCIAALAFPVRIQTEAGEALLDAWVAGSPRRVLVAMCGAPVAGAVRAMR